MKKYCQYIWLLQGLVLVALVTWSSAERVCVVDYSDGAAMVNTCSKLYRNLESALVSNEVNLYILRKAFFPTPQAAIRLLKVKYMIDFGPNITNATCPSIGDYFTDIINTTTTNEIEYAWSSSGMYTVIHPLALNLLQLQMPFVLLRAIRYFAYSSYDHDEELDTFLWDGSQSYELPSITLKIMVNSLECLPSNDTFQDIFRELTAMVSITIILHLAMLSINYRCMAGTIIANSTTNN